MRRRGRGNRSQGRGATKARASSEEVVRRLGETMSPRHFWFEQYGPDGEIEFAEECQVLAPGDQGICFYHIIPYGAAEPKTDWRERGVIPRRGIRWADGSYEPGSVEGNGDNGQDADERR